MMNEVAMSSGVAGGRGKGSMLVPELIQRNATVGEVAKQLPEVLVLRNLIRDVGEE